MSPLPPSVDPVEKIVEDALTSAGIKFHRHYGVHHGGLDFWLPDLDVFIEVKQFHTERSIRQMASVPNAILIQGRHAAEAFATMIGKH